MAYRVPFVDPKTHYARLKPEIDAAIVDCLTRGELIYREHLRRFEERFAAFVGTRYAVGLNSGFHALHFALLGAGIGPGDEVIVPAHTFVASVSAIVHCGARPVLVDVQADYTLDPNRVEDAVTPRTRAIMPVHLNGRICDMDAIGEIAERHGLAVIEDAAQAVGATYRGRKAGSLGRAGCFSFYPFKILGGFGDGGALTTDDPEIARRASLLRYNGEDRETGEYHLHGYTALLDNVQAAVLEVKLAHVPQWIAHRRTVAERYRAGLADLPGLALPHFPEDHQEDVFQNYVIRLRERDALREHLRARGVETLVHWPKPMWEHRGLGLGEPDLPETRRICREVISLPMSAETTPEHVEITVAAVRDFVEHGAPQRLRR
ncbi:MAG: DegT/DnrJ/EryC1/StrS family aminotransferase [Armatimonadota bacterium]|nr:DegT/DnrJ/EryC1/StrS family aminotransferase [Armatimonadota bacterium]